MVKMMDEKLSDETFIPRLSSVLSNYTRNFDEIIRKYFKLLEEKNILLKQDDKELEKVLFSFLCETILCIFTVHLHILKKRYDKKSPNATKLYVQYCLDVIKPYLDSISDQNIEERYENLVRDMEGYFSTYGI